MTYVAAGPPVSAPRHLPVSVANRRQWCIVALSRSRSDDTHRAGKSIIYAGKQWCTYSAEGPPDPGLAGWSCSLVTNNVQGTENKQHGDGSPGLLGDAFISKMSQNLHIVVKKTP